MKRDLQYETATGRRASPEAIALRRWIHERYVADPEALPGRFRYYEAVMAEVIDKHAAATPASTEVDDSGRVVTKGDRLWKAALMWVREHGLVRDAWVTDTTRNLNDHTGWPTVRSAVRAYLRECEVDPWGGHHPLLVVESEATAAALEPLASEYRIMAAPLRGQAGRSFLVNQVAPNLRDGQVVLAVVDLDKVGGDISASAHKRLEAATGYTLNWRPIALTDDQVTEHGIIRVPRIDNRENSGEVRMVAETEALGATTLRAIVRDELDALLPGGLDSARGRERAERAEIATLLGFAGFELDDEDPNL